MTRLKLIMTLLSVLLASNLVLAAPAPQASSSSSSSTSSYWLSQIPRQGSVLPFGTNDYQIFRNVKEFGAVGDGVTDDSAAINQTMFASGRCGQGCDSSTTQPAIVYFPPGTYRISKPIVMPYYTQVIGDAIDLPVIKGLSTFEGIALINSNPYIPGVSNPDGSGINFYTNQNNFFRQVRNFIIDMTAMPEVNPDGVSGPAGIHWQVAQATSLQNIVFNMLPKSDMNKQQGIFMENGSGGFMSDLVFNGGCLGASFGNQQFTTRNFTFNSCKIAIQVTWDWLWTFKSVNISDADIGIDMSNLLNGFNQSVGSLILLDSSIKNSQVGIKTSYNKSSIPATAGTMAVQNVDFTGTSKAVVGADGVTQIVSGSRNVDFFLQGDTYKPSSGGPARVKRVPQVPSSPTSGGCYNMPNGTATASSSASTSGPISNNSTVTNSTGSSVCTVSPVAATPSSHVQAELDKPILSDSLLSNGAVFEKSKPQYETVPASAFVSVKSAGAKGDGVTDDSDAIQKVLSSATDDQVVFFDHGYYIVTKTIDVPKDIRIVGEIWPLILAQGSFFADQKAPQPVLRVGKPGDVGNVEISDMMVETAGPAPGAIMIEWNVQGASQGSAGMWDTHVRIGGTAGTNLQQTQCRGNTTDSKMFKPECAGSFMMFHASQQSSGYMENCWFWVADHELDETGYNKLNIFNGRGVLIESHGPFWLWGTSSEHSQLYNYQVSNAKDVFMGAIQTETAYMQAAPNALDGGFTPNVAFSDPDFADCTTDTCKKTWGLRVTDSEDVFVYGGGLYSFFEDYSQDCLLTEDCQENMVDLQCSSNVNLLGLTTKASVNMINVNGQPAVKGADHRNGFGHTVALFIQD